MLHGLNVQSWEPIQTQILKRTHFFLRVSIQIFLTKWVFAGCQIFFPLFEQLPRFFAEFWPEILTFFQDLIISLLFKSLNILLFNLRMYHESILSFYVWVSPILHPGHGINIGFEANTLHFSEPQLFSLQLQILFFFLTIVLSLLEHAFPYLFRGHFWNWLPLFLGMIILSCIIFFHRQI